MVEQQRAFDLFRGIYNTERPHESLEMKAPLTRYVASRRTMPERLSSPDYPSSMSVRKLDQFGRLVFMGQQTKTTITALLAFQPIGLDPIDDDRWKVYYGPVALADVSLRNGALRFEKLR